MKLNNKQVIGVIENEGIGYAVQYYMGEDSVKDPKLAAMWKQAKIALCAITDYLDID